LLTIYGKIQREEVAMICYEAADKSTAKVRLPEEEIFFLKNADGE
jgi:hypothetical protein